MSAGLADVFETVEYGAWSIDGSLWQAMKFLVPLVGIVAVLAASTGVWQR